MSDRKITTGILRLDEDSLALLESAVRTGYFQVEAVADKDAKLASKVAAEYGCRAYDDYRQFVTQGRFDCLFVGSGIHGCDGHIRSAIKKKLHVLKAAPPGRNFEEVKEFALLSGEKEVRFCVACSGRFAKSYLALRRFLVEEDAGQPLVITGLCNSGEHVYPRWQSDPELSGGGVLLYQGYEVLDCIVSNFGMPNQVYCLRTNIAGDRQQRFYLTEDTIVMSMRFTESCCGAFSASRVYGPGEECLRIYFKDRIVSMEQTCFIVHDAKGEQLRMEEFEKDAQGCMDNVVANFALSILNPQDNPPAGSVWEHVKNMAVIDSAYLSARTGMPEEPSKLFDMVSGGKGKLPVIKELAEGGLFDPGERK